jgi:hypothetical protein
VENEEVVFDAVVRWLNHDPTGRQVYFHEVLEHVRLPLLSPYFLEDSAAKLPAIIQNLLAQDLMKEARRYHELPNRRTEVEFFTSYLA